MGLSKETIKELHKILKEDYDLEMNEEETEDIAYSYVHYFSLLKEIEDK